MELDPDDYLTLRGGIKAATFGNCLIVEPHRQGYTQGFRFKIDQALRVRGLHKTDLIEWHHGGIGHRADVSLLLDTGRIKFPPRPTRDKGDSKTTQISHHPQQRSYQVCGRCHKPDARLKCACLSTHYCDTKCQRDEKRCKLDSTENPRPFEENPTLKNSLMRERVREVLSRAR